MWVLTTYRVHKTFHLQKIWIDTKNRIRILSDIKKSDSEALKVRYFLEYLIKYPTFRASESDFMISDNIRIRLFGIRSFTSFAEKLIHALAHFSERCNTILWISASHHQQLKWWKKLSLAYTSYILSPDIILTVWL